MRLAAPRGDFALPDPPPPKLLFVTAGSGITPVMAMLRSLKARGQRPDIVHIHSAPSAESVIFHDELRELEATQPGYRLHLQLTDEDGKLDFGNLDELVSDWKERPTWACGPARDARHDRKGLGGRGSAGDQLHMERFVIARTDKGGEGGTVTFAISDKTHRNRRRHLAAGSRREGRDPDAVRLPDGHLPNLRAATGIRPRARLPVW